MKKIFFITSAFLILWACSSDTQYPEEYLAFELPVYPNATDINAQEVKSIGTDGDIEIKVSLKTPDGIEEISSFFNTEMQKRGYKRNESNMMEKLQQKGAPVSADNYFHGFYQNGGRVFVVTALSTPSQDSVFLNLNFAGS